MTDEDEYFPAPRNIRELQHPVGMAATVMAGGTANGAPTMDDRALAASDVLTACGPDLHRPPWSAAYGACAPARPDLDEPISRRCAPRLPPRRLSPSTVGRSEQPTAWQAPDKGRKWHGGQDCGRRQARSSPRAQSGWSSHRWRARRGRPRGRRRGNESASDRIQRYERRGPRPRCRRGVLRRRHHPPPAPRGLTAVSSAGPRSTARPCRPGRHREGPTPARRGCSA